MIWAAYALLGLALAGAFAATRNWAFVGAAVALYACFPLVRRLDRRLYRHRPEVHEEGEAWVATCACGWSARNRIRAEAERLAENHRVGR
ncbi:MAG TPA: hypothetical protein VFA56_11555 [Gaiellaceae bacterium]|nr:hypothetical protein [Gaiellaceae bacterium]